MKINETTPIRVRMAPSPTGSLHIGTARTALFNYLFARRHGGTFVVRIEDTDTERSTKEFEAVTVDGLSWLGMRWDEGPDKGGPYGPYRQSERTEIYKEHLQKLLDGNKAYHCFCTKVELEAQRTYLASQGLPPVYAGTCCALDAATVKKRLEGGEPSVIRFRTLAKKLAFHDLIRGTIEFDTGLFGDMVIAKSLTVPLYNFTVVVDDALMRISHVIRGDDHISNTPKQILLFEAFGFDVPVFAHVPLMLGSDRSKLSKRHGAKSVTEYRAEGYLPEAVANFIALIGWNPGDEREIFSMDELAQAFDLSRVSASGTVFNAQKLDWINAQYIRQKSSAELLKLCLPYLKEAGRDMTDEDLLRLTKIIALEKERLKKLSDIVPLSAFFFALPEYDAAVLVWKKSDKEKARGTLAASLAELEKIPEAGFDAPRIKAALDALAGSSSAGDVYWPLRVALSGREASPGPVEIADILGRKETLARIAAALEKLKP